jgi:hypothetical protein
VVHRRMPLIIAPFLLTYSSLTVSKDVVCCA